jgi:hypothetical protein
MFVSLVVAGHKAGEISIGNTQGFDRCSYRWNQFIMTRFPEVIQPIVAKLDQDRAEDGLISIDVGSDDVAIITTPVIRHLPDIIRDGVVSHQIKPFLLR